MNTPAVKNPQNSNNKIPGLLVPIATGKLILPMTSVAEIVPYQPLRPVQQVADEEIPGWYLGSLAWRGVMVPALSFEVLNGGAIAPITPDSRLIVLNNTGVNSQLPFLSIPTSGIPRLSYVAADNIFENPNLPVKGYEKMQVIVAGEPATLPDIPKVEQICAILLGYQT